MKKQTLLTLVLSIGMLIGGTNSANAQFGKLLKNAVKKNKSSSSKKGKTKGKSFSEFNSESDELGLTGEYTVLVGNQRIGLRFVKLKDGALANKLEMYVDSKENSYYTWELKEKYLRKHQLKYFTGSKSSAVEIAEGVMAEMKVSHEGRKVTNVYARDKAEFETWDIETAQAKVDMISMTIDSEEVTSNKAKLEKISAAYKNNKGKVVFAESYRWLSKREQTAHDPMVDEKVFRSKLMLGANIGYKPFFEMPLAVSHPGAWFNITYEIAGHKTDREALRKSSTFYAKNIPQMDKSIDLKGFYFFYGKAALDDRIVDYAFLELLRLAQNDFTSGKTYDLKVTVWAYKDGQNIDSVATGTLQLEYKPKPTQTKYKLFDPKYGWIPKIEGWLDE
jgi:hypothetical protein